jgi:hypothetical protein
MASAAIPRGEAAPTKDTFQTSATRDSFGPIGARLMSTRPFAG